MERNTEAQGKHVGQSAADVEQEVELGAGDDRESGFDFLPEFLPHLDAEGSQGDSAHHAQHDPHCGRAYGGLRVQKPALCTPVRGEEAYPNRGQRSWEDRRRAGRGQMGKPRWPPPESPETCAAPLPGRRYDRTGRALLVRLQMDEPELDARQFANRAAYAGEVSWVVDEVVYGLERKRLFDLGEGTHQNLRFNGIVVRRKRAQKCSLTEAANLEYDDAEREPVHPVQRNPVVPRTLRLMFLSLLLFHQLFLFLFPLALLDLCKDTTSCKS